MRRAKVSGIYNLLELLIPVSKKEKPQITMHEEARNAINDKKSHGAVWNVGITAGRLWENGRDRDGGRQSHGKFCGAVTAEGSGFAFDRVEIFRRDNGSREYVVGCGIYGELSAEGRGKDTRCLPPCIRWGILFCAV